MYQPLISGITNCKCIAKQLIANSSFWGHCISVAPYFVQISFYLCKKKSKGKKGQYDWILWFESYQNVTNAVGPPNWQLEVLVNCDRSIWHHLCNICLFAVIIMEVRSLGPSVQPPDFEIMILILSGALRCEFQFHNLIQLCEKGLGF